MLTALPSPVRSTSGFGNTPASGPVETSTQAPDANGIVDFTLTGLTPGVGYEYTLEADGTLVEAADVTFWWCGAVQPTSARVIAKMAGAPASVRCVANPRSGEYSAFGRFRTPPDGPHTFSCVVGSCSASASNHPAYDAMLARSPDLFLMLGDFFYADIATNDESMYRAAYEGELAAAKQKALYDVTPVVLTVDDHDYGADNSGADSPSRPAMNAVYRQYVPSYPLVEATTGIYHAFVRGRVRFIVSDLRNFKSPEGDADDTSKTMMGATQKQWFKDQITNATEPVIIWLNSLPWIEAVAAGSDSWGGYTTEREELANHIAASGKAGRLVIVSGDMHALAFDDGTNSDYASAGNAPLKVCHAAAIDRAGSTKGGPYTIGPHANPVDAGQFGQFIVSDEGGDSIRLSFEGFRVTIGAVLSTVVAKQEWSLAA